MIHFSAGHPLARGVFYGLQLLTTRADMNRAVLESCGYGLRQLSEIAGEMLGGPVRRFSSFGGGAKSAVWSQIKADITGSRDAYERGYRTYTALYPALKDLFART